MTPILKDWDFQKELDLLVASGFAVVNEARTDLWRRGALADGKATYHRCYSWTPEGRIACFRSRNTTPMAWAEDIHFERSRHCVVCGRDCYYKKVWAHDGPFRCVCLYCSGKGHGLQDLVSEVAQ